ncbi:hypothetical protein CRG98_040591 [Punica granatum]|uniref:Uncharacterized protein n=1 Tax=Punica granatum TaxID=22663 RepID=A0A2I0I4T4_PUNGR|nr:hypothetical protein CRG98_040591 [Punica granatum]
MEITVISVCRDWTSKDFKSASETFKALLGRLPLLQEGRAPARRVAECTSACLAGLQYARAHCPLDCGVLERLLGGFSKMHGRLPDELHDALLNEKVHA